MIRSRRTLARLVASPLAAVLIASAPSAFADPAPADRTRAEGLFQEGRALMNSGDFAKACAKFEAAQALDPGGGTALALGLCYEKQDKLRTALETLRGARALADRSGRRDRAEYVDAKIAELGRAVSHLEIVPPAIQPAGLAIRVGTEEFPRARWGLPAEFDGGNYEIEASAPGYVSARVAFVVGTRGDNARVLVPNLVPAAPAPAALVPTVAGSTSPAVPAGRPTAARFGTGRTIGLGLSAGVGALGVAFGSYFGLRAISKLDAARGGCPTDNTCTGAAMAQDSASLEAANISTGAFIVGGVGLATAAYLFLSAPKPSTSTVSTLVVLPVVSPSGITLSASGTF